MKIKEENMKKYTVKPTIFNISLVITPFLMLLAYWERGYFACGGEVLAPLVGFVAHYAFKEWWEEK